MSDLAQAIDPVAVRSALSRMLVSPDFGGSARVRAFLSYVVEEKLEGRPDRIKAYNIATSVFGRDVNFDANLDPIVRIEAGRVRRSIERYYLLGGKGERLHIGMPKGSYVPVFEVAERAICSVFSEPGVGPEHGPAVLVERLGLEGDHPELASFAAGLSRRVVVDLARFHGLRVFQGGPADTSTRWDYVLSGTVGLVAGTVQADLVLTDTRSGQAVWADSVTEDNAAAAAEISRTLGEPFGVIHRHRNRFAAVETAGEAEVDGVADFYRYWMTFEPTLLRRAQRELEQMIRRAPGEAELLACQSLLLSGFGGLRDRDEFSDSGAEERALVLADRAVMLAPASSWAHYAAGLASWALRDIDGALDALEVAHRLNPLDRSIAAELGQRYAILARWDRARCLIGDAFAGNLALPGALRIGSFLLHFAHGRYDRALMEARRIPHQLSFAFAAVAAAEIRVGHRDAAAVAMRRLQHRLPVRGAIDALLPPNMDPDLAENVADALKAAGLPSAAPRMLERPERPAQWPDLDEMASNALMPDPVVAATSVAAGTGGFGVELL